MDFTHRKLPREAATQLRRCPIRTIAPYAFTQSPIYVYMNRNQKFISVKAPLDFFTPEELEKLKSFENFFVPEVVDSVLPFKNAAKSVRALLSWKPQVPSGETAKGYPQIALPIAPYELSDAVIRVIGPLWGSGVVIEPFFVAVFANELCDVLPEKLLFEARENSVELYERAIFFSAWSVFLALHTGNCQLDYLNNIRKQAFEFAMRGEEGFDHLTDTREVFKIASDITTLTGTTVFSAEFFKDRKDKLSLKLKSRLERVETQFINKNLPVPTIFGAKGFIHV